MAYIPEVEPNNTQGTAQELSPADFTLDFDSTIHDGSLTNTSTSIPHVSVEATGDDTRDFYSFYANAGDTIIIDIDFTSGIDSELYLDGPSLSLYNDDAFWSGGDPGSSTTLDSFIETTAPTSGTYYVEVTEWSSWSGPPESGAEYTLHVSVDNPCNDITGIDGQQNILNGTADSDCITGGDRRDELYGGDGPDVLNGGDAADDLWGGAGADTFLFPEMAEGRDYIHDFEPGVDIIDVSGIGSATTAEDFRRGGQIDTEVYVNGQLVVTVLDTAAADVIPSII